MLLILVYHDSTAGKYETRKLQENKIYLRTRDSHDNDDNFSWIKL